MPILVTLKENSCKCSKCGSNKVYLLSDSYNYWCPDCKSFTECNKEKEE